MTENNPTHGNSPTDGDAWRIELSLVLEFEEELVLGADGEENEDWIRREALDYTEEAARDGAFEIEFIPLDETIE